MIRIVVSLLDPVEMEALNSATPRVCLQRWLRPVTRIVAVAYLLVLTLFLVHPDAFALFGSGAESAEVQVDATVPGLLQHLCAYVLLGALLYAGFVGPRFSALSILVVTVLHGLSTEAIQAVVPNRTSDWRDLLADASGAILAVAMCSWVRRPRRGLSQLGICLLLVLAGGCLRSESSDLSRAESAATANQPSARFTRAVDWIGQGQWIKIETHCHTTFSDGAHTIEEVVAKAVSHGCDAVAITDHIDRLDREDIPQYLEAIDVVKRQFPDLLVLVGLEWNVPPSGGDDHATVLFPDDMADAETLIEFCERFDDFGREVHDPALATEGLNWLEDHVGTDGIFPVVSLNHPSRKCDSSAEVYDFFLQLTGPSRIMVGFSGAPGHQAGGVIGAYDGPAKTVDRWDPVSLPGDTWDRLLQAERDVWGALAPCDFHRHGGDHWGDYWPGEFSETWVYVPDRSTTGVLRGLKAGTFFADHGGIVREAVLSLEAEGLDRPAQAGEALEVPAGTRVRIRFTAQVPQNDLFGEPNHVDEIEFITVTSAGVQTQQIVPFEGREAVAEYEFVAGEGSTAVRVRGRRQIPDGPDLMFCSNPIRVTINEAIVDTNGSGSCILLIGAP